MGQMSCCIEERKIPTERVTSSKKQELEEIELELYKNTSDEECSTDSFIDKTLLQMEAQKRHIGKSDEKGIPLTSQLSGSSLDESQASNKESQGKITQTKDKSQKTKVSQSYNLQSQNPLAANANMQDEQNYYQERIIEVPRDPAIFLNEESASERQTLNIMDQRFTFAGERITQNDERYSVNSRMKLINMKTDMLIKSLQGFLGVEEQQKNSTGEQNKLTNDSAKNSPRFGAQEENNKENKAKNGKKSKHEGKVKRKQKKKSDQKNEGEDIQHNS